jgi:hypothetical protein
MVVRRTMQTASWIFLTLACGSCSGIPRAQDERPVQPDPPESDPFPNAPLSITAGDCDAYWLPIDHEALDAEEQQDLIEGVRRWLEGAPDAIPLIDETRGVLYTQNAIDEAMDPPYPASHAAYSARACGLPARWIRDHAHTYLQFAAKWNGGVVCDGTVCCAPSPIESSPDRLIVLRRTDYNGYPWFALDAAIQVTEAALPDETVRANREELARALRAMAASQCGDQPAELHAVPLTCDPLRGCGSPDNESSSD